MKKIIFSFLILTFIVNTGKSQFVEIPDSNFRNVLKAKYPTCFNANDQMDTTCSLIVNEIGLFLGAKNVKSIEGIQYFKNLVDLDCDTNQLSSLPPLPSSLRSLFCNFNQLSFLPELPPLLYALYCSDNKLTILPKLTNSLIFLDCSINQLLNLPSLPESLSLFYCYYNQITNIPTLPPSIQTIICAYNNLTSLPNFPSTLTSLYCDFNHINEIPPLPFGILDLSCESNNLNSLPILPNSLEYLNCMNNPINCLPNLSNALFSFYVKGTNIKCFPNIPPHSTPDTILPICTDPSDICQVTGLASNKNLDFKLYPNPTNGTVRLELPYSGEGNWMLSDISGRQIKTNYIANGEKVMELNLSDLPSGTYFITIQLGNNVSTAKVIKM